MAAVELLDFEDIYKYVAESVGVDTAQIKDLNKLKRMINHIYQNKVSGSGRHWWLEKEFKWRHERPYIDGTVSVTAFSDQVTLSVAPTTAVGNAGSFAGYKFTTSNFDEIYEVSAHTAESTTLTLDSEFQGETGTEIQFFIWRDWIDLPTDARETVDIVHARRGRIRNLKGEGRKKFNDYQTVEPKAISYPVYYRTGDFYDPSTGTSETESDRYRRTVLHPSIMPNQENVTLRVTYIQEATALDLDGDEPLLPVEQRDVIALGAMWLAFKQIVRDDSTAETYRIEFERRLKEINGMHGDSQSNPQIGVRSEYLNGKKRRRIGARGIDYDFYSRAGGGGGLPQISYLDCTRINDPQFTGTIKANSSLVKDEDTLVSDSDVHLATQQSIKAYIDTQVAAQVLRLTDDQSTPNTDNVLLASGTLTFAEGSGAKATVSDDQVIYAQHLKKVAKTESDLSTAANTNDIELFEIPANKILKKLIIKTTQAFSGGSVSAVSLDVGITGDLTKFLVGFDGAAAVGNTNFDITDAYEPAFGAAKSVRLQITTTSDTIDNLTAGAVSVWYELADLES